MIDFRTNKDFSDVIFENPTGKTITITSGNNSRSCGIYDNGIIFYYGRELTDKEIEKIMREQEIARQARDRLEQAQFQRFTKLVEASLDDTIPQRIDDIVTKAFSK